MAEIKVVLCKFYLRISDCPLWGYTGLLCPVIVLFTICRSLIIEVAIA